MLNHFRKTLLILGLHLTACEPAEPPLSSEKQILNYVKYLKIEILDEYLNCYAYAPSDKQLCHDDIAKKYPHSHKQLAEKYKELFQFEAERQGFRHFLLNKQLTCKSLIEGPKFDDVIKAYQVICQPNQKYLMKFDYDKKEWQLIE